MPPDHRIHGSFRIAERKRLLELLGQQIAALRQHINETQPRIETVLLKCTHGGHGKALVR